MIPVQSPPPPPPPAPTSSSRTSDSVFPAWQSPLKMQSHCTEIQTPIVEQLRKECSWLKIEDRVMICFSHDVPSKLQDGPQCGIVAMWMAAKCLVGEAEIPSVEDIQRRAIDLKFSANGEMFSAQNMEILFNDLFGKSSCKAILGNSFSSNLLSSFRTLLEMFLAQKQLFLVPYDADSDQRPGLRNGHKAHWVVLSGLAVTVPSSFLSNEEYRDFCLVDEPGLKILDSRRLPVHLISGLFTENPEQFYFVARQSKSRRIFLFDAKALAASNSNLVEFSRGSKRSEDMEFVLPTDGIQNGLANKDRCLPWDRFVCLAAFDWSRSSNVAR